MCVHVRVSVCLSGKVSEQEGGAAETTAEDYKAARLCFVCIGRLFCFIGRRHFSAQDLMEYVLFSVHV